MQFGIRFPPAEGPESTARLAREAEEAGFGYVWGVDSPLLAGALFDPYVDLAAAALNTSKVKLGPCVTPLLLRSPVATAAAILSLDRVSDGRAILGMGSGGSALVTLGISKRQDRVYTAGAIQRQAQLREEVTFLRRLFAGEPVSMGARDIQIDPPRPIKIYIAATGPRALELAGEIADGVFIHVGIWPPAIKDAIERIRRGAEKAGRNFSDIDLVSSTYTAVSADGNRKADARYIKPEVSFLYTQRPDLLEQAGFDTSRRVPEKMPHPDMTHAYDWEEAMQAADSYIPDEVAETFCLVGPPSDAVRRIRELQEMGITQLYVRGPSSYELPHELVTTFAEHVVPHFA
jgi:5,10-methylenetetrahydromethanopterin reductase